MKYVRSRNGRRRRRDVLGMSGLVRVGVRIVVLGVFGLRLLVLLL